MIAGRLRAGHNALLRLLDRYIIGDLLRLVVLTAAVLVTVIAFGATIKPLAHDRLLSAGQTMKYIVLAIVPMLQFALPFAAGFAGTLSLHRMTTDNEILAAAIGGVSYRRVLAPVVFIGLALTLIMLMLTQWIVPLRVVRGARRTHDRGRPALDPHSVGRSSALSDRRVRAVGSNRARGGRGLGARLEPDGRQDDAL